jgi:hypothetical protein
VLGLYESASLSGPATNPGQLKNDFKHLQCDLGVRQALKKKEIELTSGIVFECNNITSVVVRRKMETYLINECKCRTFVQP